MKKFTSILAAAVVVVALASCGSKNAESTDTMTTDSSAMMSTETAAPMTDSSAMMSTDSSAMMADSSKMAK